MVSERLWHRKIIVFLVFFMSLTAMVGQDDYLPCGSQKTTDEWQFFNRYSVEKSKYIDAFLAQRPSQKRQMTDIPIHAVIFQQDDGSGGVAVSNIEASINFTNTFFANAGIQFYLCSNETVDDSDFYNFDNDVTPIGGIAAMYNEPYKLNIYYAQTVSTGGSAVGGFFSGFGQLARVIVRNSTANGMSTTLAHELGHFFSLDHTHGKFNFEVDDCNGALWNDPVISDEVWCQGAARYDNTTLDDNANGIPDCRETGDDICDTPAEPRLSRPEVNINACAYVNGPLDPLGSPYNPNVGNVMSYGPCVDHMTTEQYARISASLMTDYAFFNCNLCADYSGSEVVVTNIGDDCEGSLRWAMEIANLKSNINTIRFDLPNPNNSTITLQRPLPDIIQDVTIDATTQPGYVPGGINISGVVLQNELDNGFNIRSDNVTIKGVQLLFFPNQGISAFDRNNILIEEVGIGGSGRLSAFGDGIFMQGCQNVTIRDGFIGTNPSNSSSIGNNRLGLLLIANDQMTIDGCVIASNGSTGAQLQACTNVTITNNFIGLGTSGAAVLSNQGNGILAIEGSQINIGLPGEGNVISSNTGSGLQLQELSDVGIYGNILGLDVNGSLPRSNQGSNIVLSGCTDVDIGSVEAGARNVISSSANGRGISIQNETAHVRIRDNYIGTDISGTVSRGNRWDGVSIFSCDDITIGGATEADGNLISNNGFDGIYVDNSTNDLIQNNVIGLDHLKINAMGNAQEGIRLIASSNVDISHNYVAYNSFAGILLIDNSHNNPISQNHIFCNGNGIGDDGINLDFGNNNGIDKPGISVDDASTLSGTADANSTIEIFKDNSNCPNCQGRTFVGSTTANAAGNWMFTFDDPLADGERVSATQTLNSNTSEIVCQIFSCGNMNLQITTNFPDPFCVNDDPVILNGTPEGGIFLVADAALFQFDPQIFGAGNHTLRYQLFDDPTQCLFSTETTVVVQANPEVVIQDPDIIGCNMTSVTLDAAQSVGVNPIFAWSTADGNILSGSNTATPTVDAAGTYDVVVTNLNGCSSMASVEVIADDADFVQSQFGASTTELSATFSDMSTGDPFQWNWDFGDGNMSMEQNPMHTYDAGGVYTVCLEAVNPCGPDETCMEVTVFSPIVILSDMVMDVSCFEGSDGSIDIEISGGIEPYTYAWTGPNTYMSADPSISDLIAGMYSVIVSDEMGTSVAEQSFEVGQPTQLALESADTTPSDCAANTGSMQVHVRGGTPPYTYDIGGGPSTDSTFTDLAAQSFSVMIEDSRGCRDTFDVVVPSSDGPVVDLGEDIRRCVDESVTLDAGNDGAVFQWFMNNMPIVGATAAQLVVTESANYSVAVTNAAMCTTEDVISVAFEDPPFVELGEDQLSCVGQSVVLFAGDLGPAFTWALDGMGLNETSNQLTASVSGLYTVEVRSDIGCTSNDTVEIRFFAAPIVDLGEDMNLCLGDMYTLDAGSDGTVYRWFRDDQIIVGAQSSTLDVMASGTYRVEVENEATCTTTDDVNIFFSPLPMIDLGEDRSACEGDNIQLIASPGQGTYQWFLNDVPIPQATGPTLMVTASGVYRLEIENEFDCQSADEVSVTIDPLPMVSMPIDHMACIGETITLDAGIAGQSYQWSFNNVEINGANDQILMVDQGGLYSVQVTSDANCTASAETNVSFLEAPSIDLDDMAGFCQDGSTVISAVSNGTAFQWFLNGNILPGETSTDLTVSQSGIYRFEAINAANCRSGENIQVIEYPKPQVELGVDTSLCPGATLNLNVDAFEQINWSTGETTTSIDIQVPVENPTSTTEEVSVMVENTFGCMQSDAIRLTFLASLQAEVMSDATGLCPGEFAQLSASGGDTYEWINGASSLSASDISDPTAMPGETTTYTVRVGSDQCPEDTDEASIEIQVFESTSVSAGPDTCIIKGASIDLMASGGAFYEWQSDPAIRGSLNSASPTVEPEETTTFVVTITDINGCSFVDDVNICVKDDPTEFIVPVTLFTPNSDGKNDFLFFRGLDNFPDNTITVFNRWGNIVFQRRAYQVDGNRWDGSFNGKPLPAGTYYYVLQFSGLELKRALTIIRD